MKFNFTTFYQAAILLLLSIIATALIIICVNSNVGRYARYGADNLVIDTKTGKLYKYELFTRRLIEYKE